MLGFSFSNEWTYIMSTPVSKSNVSLLFRNDPFYFHKSILQKRIGNQTIESPNLRICCFLFALSSLTYIFGFHFFIIRSYDRFFHFFKSFIKWLFIFQTQFLRNDFEISYWVDFAFHMCYVWIFKSSCLNQTFKRFNFGFNEKINFQLWTYDINGRWHRKRWCVKGKHFPTLGLRLLLSPNQQYQRHSNRPALYCKQKPWKFHSILGNFKWN